MSQFQTISETGIFPMVTQGRPSNALIAFFQRISNEEKIVEALNHFNAVTFELQQVLLQYYEWLMATMYGHGRERNIALQLQRLLNSMEIKTPFSHDAEGNNILGRIFVWLDRGERMAAQGELPKECNAVGKVKEYTGRASRKEKEEPEGPLDNPKATMHIYEYKKKVGDVELTFFYWMLKWDKSKIGEETDTLEKAAEAVYRCFYKNMSKLKLDKALAPAHNKWVVLLGNWVTKADIDQLPRKDIVQVIPDVATDERDGLMFVLGYPNASKQKEKVLPKDIRMTKAAHKGSINAMDFTLELKSGAKVIGSMDWYIYRPEDQIGGEIYCPCCDSAGTLGSLGACHVRGQGLLCGPCIDYKMEHGLDDSMFDATF